MLLSGRLPVGDCLMTVAEIIDGEVMSHLALYGCCKNLDPYAAHLLKTSKHPLLVARRTWMRQEALRQVLEAEAEQKKMSAHLHNKPWDKRSPVRQSALISPHYMEDLRRTHNGSFRDKDFVKFVKREEPGLFPNREVT